ncbi:MAG: alpha/beta hydrolase-fold protein [Acidobacteriota bacterium]
MMKNYRRCGAAATVTLFVAIFISAAAAANVFAAEAVRFTVRLDPSVAGSVPVSGRLLIFMKKDDGKPSDGFGVDDLNPNAVYVSGTELTDLSSDKAIEINADELSFPTAFSAAPAGNYLVFALLDRDHSYTYNGPGTGDIYSPVVKVTMPSTEAAITLNKAVPERKITVPANARLIEFESPLLSAFWGRPIMMKASVILPPSYDTARSQKYPTVYDVSGYGGTRLNALRGAAAREKEMKDGKRPEMINVYLEAQVPMGHSVFADSANNGPWGTALVNEFIPYLEKQFRMDAKPSGRFLTGHSSGGWTTMWVIVTHPDFFGGTWSTSPDPVDFRNFTGPDITKMLPQNAFMDPSGKEYNLVRDGGKELMTFRQYAQQERVLGYYGGQMASFNAVFSPKGDDGQPMKLFDFDTGRIDPDVQKAWQKYNISKLLTENWKTLGPKLKGKIHIFVGTADTFHLNESVKLLDDELKKLGSDARIEYIEGRTHFNLYEGGLAERIASEMYAVARPKAKVKSN